MAHLLAAAVAALLSLGGSGALDFICTESPLKLTFIHPIHGLQCGTSLNASNIGLLTAPSITYSRSLAARNYTVMMLDPDASSHAPRLHWLVVDIPGKFLGGHELAIDGLGTTLSDYTPPRPPPNSGYHRYGFFLLQQPSARQTFAVDLSTQDFNYSAFIQEFNLGPKLESNYMLVSAGTCEIPALPVYTQSVCEGSTLAPGNTCKIRCIPGYAQAKGNYDYKCEASKLSEPEPNCMPCPSDTEQPRVGGTNCTSCAQGCSTGNKKAQPRCSCAVPEPESGPEPEPDPEPEPEPEPEPAEQHNGPANDRDVSQNETEEAEKIAEWMIAVLIVGGCLAIIIFRICCKKASALVPREAYDVVVTDTSRGSKAAAQVRGGSLTASLLTSGSGGGSGGERSSMVRISLGGSGSE